MTVNSFVGLSACDPESGFNDTTVFLCETEFSRSTRPGPPLTALSFLQGTSSSSPSSSSPHGLILVRPPITVPAAA